MPPLHGIVDVLANQIILVGPTGKRVSNLQVPLTVGVVYKKKLVEALAKPSRNLIVVPAVAIDEHGEAILRVPTKEISKDWPAPVRSDTMPAP